MGTKSCTNFIYPGKCIGANTFSFGSKTPLKVGDDHNGSISSVDILLKQTPVYQHESPVHCLTFVTYNVWFQFKNVENRVPCILKLLQASNADFICLQEVTYNFLKQLQKQQWAQKYSMSGYPMNSYDCLILSKFSCKFSRVLYKRTGMERSLLIAKTRINGRDLSVATSHFESMDNQKLRIQQLETAFQTLNDQQDAILMGDFNFDSRSGKEEKAIPEKWKDIYLGRHESVGLTMPDTNKFAGWRPDRMLIKSENYRPEEIEIIGNFTVPPFESDKLEDIKNDGVVRTPSDHFGLAALVRYNPK